MCTKEEVRTELEKHRLKVMEDVDASINKRINHLAPSPKTLDSINDIRMNCVRTTGAFKTKMEVTQKDVRNVSEKQDEMHAEIKEMRKEIKENYAGKWVENALKWATFLIVGAVIASIVNQVLK